jgi:hypothetical protein
LIEVRFWPQSIGSKKISRVKRFTPGAPAICENTIATSL